MLIEKSPNANDIIVLKLVTSEELVAKLVSQTADTVTISKPLTLSITVDERTGRPGLQMLPFFLLGADTDAKIALKNVHILTMSLARDDVKSGYVHNTSGLQIPTSEEKGLLL